MKRILEKRKMKASLTNKQRIQILEEQVEKCVELIEELYATIDGHQVLIKGIVKGLSKKPK